VKRPRHFVVIDLRDRTVAEALAALPLSQHFSALISSTAELGNASAPSFDGIEETGTKQQG